MYERVLVPLDGSALAEGAVGYAAELLRGLGRGEAVLATVVEGATAEALRLAEGYLDGQAAAMARRWREAGAEGPTARAAALRAPLGQAGSALVRFAEEERFDLVVMTTHGRSGVDRWLLGSVAEKVLRAADVPVLLLRAAAGSAEKPSFQRLLVPLDGSTLAEEAIPYAEALARAFGSSIVLLYVEPAAGEPGPGQAPRPRLRKAEREDVRRYLESAAARLEGSGILVEALIRIGDPGTVVGEEAGRRADLVVLSSHGRTGLARWAFGSVADQVARSSPSPVLMVRAQARGGAAEPQQGPMVYRCYHCGRREYREAFTEADRCSRCVYLLKACGNCVQFDGALCQLRLPEALDTYPGNRCSAFQFRKTRLVLR